MIDKEVLKKIILENQEFLKTIKVQTRLYEFDENANYVVVGSRRAGKTYSVFSHIHHLTKQTKDFNKVLYINFEDERLIELKTEELDLLIQTYRELYTFEPLLFFDEIQNIRYWEKFVRRLADTGYRIFVTGSNANMLSKEIGSTLGGRFLIKEILPLSFREYLSFNKQALAPHYEYSTKTGAEIKKHFEAYLNFGGFPEILLYRNKKEYLTNLYQKVFYGDIIVRYSVGNEHALRIFVKKIAESVCNETSYNRIKNIIKSAGIAVGVASLIDYTAYLCDSFLIYSIPNFFSKISEREGKRKLYFIDTGILNLFLTDQPQQLLENLVYIQLYRQYKNSIYYVQSDFEIDFFVPEEQMLIQVCLNMSAYETRERELKSLKKGMRQLSIQKASILTKDESETIEEDGLEIQILPVWKWLLRTATPSLGQ